MLKGKQLTSGCRPWLKNGAFVSSHIVRKSVTLLSWIFFHFWSFIFKPGFHIVVSVVSVVRKQFIGQIQLYGNLPYKS